MKAIHYDTEGDILSVTFYEAEQQKQVGFELSDNIVLYYNPETNAPLKLLFLSYRVLLQASSQTPISLDGLTHAPADKQATVTDLLKKEPLTVFLQIARCARSNPGNRQTERDFHPCRITNCCGKLTFYSSYIQPTHFFQLRAKRGARKGAELTQRIF